MSDKTFTVAGVSTLKGEVKLRVANDMASRVKTLTKNGHTDVRLIELGSAMTKRQAAQYLIDSGFDADVPASIDAINAEIARIDTKSAKEAAAEAGAEA